MEISIIQHILPYLGLLVIALTVLLIANPHAKANKSNSNRTKRELEEIDNKIEQLQESYFIKKEITKKQFNELLKEHKNKLIELTKKAKEYVRRKTKK